MNEEILSEPRTCRTCKQRFTINNDQVCCFHPESYSGETAQRWKAPGCCGGTENSAGCCRRRHLTFDDPEDVTQLRPGMHKRYEVEKKVEAINEKVNKLTINEDIKK